MSFWHQYVHVRLFFFLDLSHNNIHSVPNRAFIFFSCISHCVHTHHHGIAAVYCHKSRGPKVHLRSFFKLNYSHLNAVETMVVLVVTYNGTPIIGHNPKMTHKINLRGC